MVGQTRASKPPPWGPDGRRAAVSLTWDNLGEATDLERGLWPDHEPLGRHFSVTRALPRILELLAELDLRATFFVEGLNTELYPATLVEIAAAGHEIACHGWRHERWAGLTPARERDVLERSVHAMRKLSIRPLGFRPPGGSLTASSLAVLEDLDFAYCSPAGRGYGIRGGVVVLPFQWPTIDAFHYLSHFGDLREAVLGARDVLSPRRFRHTLEAALNAAIEQGEHLSLLFHPFLEDEPERFEVVRQVLRRLRALVDDGLVWCVPHHELAAWMRDVPGAHDWALELGAGGGTPP